ncbi:MAG: hypothetical protein WC367_05315 [Methanoregula sp.]|jgi:hypothetical protein
MAKFVPLPTRAFGAEPGIPGIAALAGWIAEHRGTAADLTGCMLDFSLAPQLEAGITAPCAGGLFCRDRVVGSFTGLNEKMDTITGEIDIEGTALAADAAMLATQKKNVWCALPAPSELGITDAYYHDEDEREDAVAVAYGKIMRNMRDAGIGGHILIAEKAVSCDIVPLARKNVFFFVPSASKEDLETLLEYQKEVAVGPSPAVDLSSLTDEFEINRVFLIDPDDDAIMSALSSFDPDQISVGGYCTGACDTYWKKLAKSAVYRK